MTFTNHDPIVDRKPTGLFHASGTELTHAEARRHGLRPLAVDDAGLPRPAQVPTYSTDRLFTRDQLIDVFRHAWNDGTIGLHQVDVFIRTHGLRPVAHEPYRPMPDVTDDDTSSGDHMARRQFDEWVNGRGISRRGRELFSIDGLPVYIPDASLPSPNDTYAQRVRKNETIESL